MNNHIIARIRMHTESTMDDIAAAKNAKNVSEEEVAIRVRTLEAMLTAYNICEDIVRALRYTEANDGNKIPTRAAS